jgi:metalloendopeptidase OMA1, mitochondrial
MKRIALWSLITVLAFAPVGCFDRVNFIPDSQLNAMGESSYKEVLAKEKPSSDKEAQAFIERVGRRLAAAAPDEGFKYEFTLIDSPTINAFCLPGGKVAIYTGILPYCENEAGLAAVMGHEIAHAIDRHGGKRMSQGLVIGGAQTALGEVLKANKVNPTASNLGLAAFGLGAQIGVFLPFSREHEMEADRDGLSYMAKAGYDPHEAEKFWQRFATLGSSGPELLSTHPQSEDRAAQMRGKMGAAMKLYNKAPKKYGAGEAVPKKYQTKPAAQKK